MGRLKHKPTFEDSEGYKIKCPTCFTDLRRMLFRIGVEVKDGNRILCENKTCQSTSKLTSLNGQFRLERLET